MVLEVGPKGQGRLHAHVLFTGRYIKQSRLSVWAQQAGFGRVVDIREVPSGDAAANLYRLLEHGAPIAT